MAEEQTEMFEFKNEPIKGYPELRWAGKRPFTGTSYYPAQLKETHGKAAEDGWMNKLYWGDNLQVMSHLLKEYRGKVNLIYIDPPFDSKADYKKKIKLRGEKIKGNSSNFEEKQYGDIWTNDEYLQFMYERLILCKELLSDVGTIYLHCDYHKNHHLRCLLDEIFGPSNIVNEIIWHYHTGMRVQSYFNRKHDDIYIYSKTKDKFVFNYQMETRIYPYKPGMTSDGGAVIEEILNKDGIPTGIYKSNLLARDVWDISQVFNMSNEYAAYPTQKPEELLEKIIRASSNPGDIIFDCFMGSGTTQAVAMKLGRKFIGADINLGAIQTTTKRLIKRMTDLQDSKTCYTGFEVYNVNDYEFFRNELEAKKLIIEALGMQALPEHSLWDAELDGRMVAILGINRIATASEFEKIIANVDIAAWRKKQLENPDKPVEHITFVCMGHDPNLAAMFLEKMELMGFKVDLQIVDILRDKKDLTFKRDADADIEIKNNILTVKQFYPMNLLQKLSIEKQDVEDWKELVDSIMIDWNYDDVNFTPNETDIPEKKEMVKGSYVIPADAGKIHIKITDLISESWEGTFTAEGVRI